MSATTSEISALEVSLAGVEPLTEDEINRSLRLISRRAWDASREHNATCRGLGDAHALAEKTYWDALIESQTDHPDRKVGHHEAIAKQAALEPAARVQALTLMERSLRVEMQVLEKLVSALQTQAKQHREAG